jgi:hypothetical protein
VYYGSLSGTGTTLTGSTFGGTGTLFNSDGTTQSITLSSGALVPDTSLTGNWADTTGDTGSFSLNYTSLSTRPVALADLAGDYVSSWINTGGTVSLTVAADGTFSGTGSSGSYGGSLSLPNASINLFDLSMTVGSQQASGFAFWSDGEDSHFTGNAMYVLANDSSSAVAAVLVKQVGTVAIKNATGQAITGVWIVADPQGTDGNWGSNLLASSATIATGTTQAFPNIPAGSYDAQVQLADSTTQTATAFKVGVGSTYTATFNNEEGGVVVENNSGLAVTGVWIVPDPEGTNGTWGNSLLTGTATIATGSSQTFTGLVAGAYDAKVELTGSLTQTATDFKVNAGASYTFTITNPYGTIQLDNSTGSTVTAVYIVLDPQGNTDDAWGSNLLTSDIAVAGDAQFTTLLPGSYDVGYVDSASPTTLWYFPTATTVTAGKVVTLTATGQ